ncbi:bestrophin family protein [Sphingobacterium sp. IITKGP-BTPF85]|uniref:bestrophin family protein n=1 Tax=Sphingobacterium sp. IITKGP-BTPF85 TaxID=1338009 RepID=UPI000389DDC5|nr:bestrophin family ion channel [Sphingobacterium sp. IITKGP-BTPF85]KKX50842.1 membrane protein [Sphingobacterium sp. IITKGP-BTPF85]
MVGTVVSLLMAFRTAQSYERWWEARTIWGAIVNDSRTLIRQFIQFVPENSKEEVKQFAEIQIIWTYALGQALRKEKFSRKIQSYLDIHQIRAVNIPNALLDKHSETIKKLSSEEIITEFRQVQLNETIARLCDSMGKCERIKNTVFPRSYSLLVHTLIYVFATILPFGLDDSQLTVEIVMTVLMPTLFIAIEKTAIIMQDPFENTPVDTPMTALAQTIEINLLEMIGEKEIPVKVQSDTYYEM